MRYGPADANQLIAETRVCALLIAVSTSVAAEPCIHTSMGPLTFRRAE